MKTIKKVTLVSYLFGMVCLLTSLLGGCNESVVVISDDDEETEINSLLSINMLGELSTYQVNEQGMLRDSILCASTDGKFTLSLQEGTSINLGIAGHIEEISIDIADTPPKELPKEYVFVSPVYKVTPEHAETSSPISISIGYDPDKLPERVLEDDLFVGNFPYIGCCRVYEEWDVPTNQSVDVNNNMITVQASNLLQYAIIAAVEMPSPSTTPAPPEPTPDEPSSQTGKVEVVYFYRIPRCYSCNYVEEMVRYTLDEYFSKQLSIGTVSYSVYNIEDENNAAIVETYNAYTSSLFINSKRDGGDHIKEITSVWMLIDNHEAFIKEVGGLVTEALWERE